MYACFVLYLCHLSVNALCWGSSCVEPPDTVVIKLYHQLQFILSISNKIECINFVYWMLEVVYLDSCWHVFVCPVFVAIWTWTTNGVALTLERISDAALCKGYLCLLGIVWWDAIYKVTNYGQAKSISHYNYLYWTIESIYLVKWHILT